MPLVGQLVRLDLHRDGPPAVDGVRAACRRRRRSRRRSAPAQVVDLADRCSRCCTASLAVVEVALLVRFARELPPVRGAARARTGRRRGRATTDRWPSPTEPARRPAPWNSPTVWFVLIAVLWIGYFVLEGFDFGVGMLLPVLGRDETERRVLINTIGPVWDGNEVWLLVAGGATFAAFPEWYATLFSGFYLPLLLILVALILRGVAFEYRGKGDTAAWRRRWDVGIVVGSLRARAAVGRRLRQHRPRRADRRGQASTSAAFFDLLNPYALLGGLTTLTLFTAARRGVPRAEDRRRRARPAPTRWRRGVGVVRGAGRGGVPGLDPGGARRRRGRLALSVGRGGRPASAALLAVLREREGWAFLGTAAAIGLAVTALFVALFPDVMPSSLDEAWSPDDDQRVVHRLHPEDHDLGGGDLHADRAGLPGLDLLGVPHADRHRATCPGAPRSSREAVRPAPAPARPRPARHLARSRRPRVSATAALVVVQAFAGRRARRRARSRRAPTSRRCAGR